MLRGKYLAGNLKREKERTFARYLVSFLSQARDPARGRIFQQGEPGNDERVTRENATISESRRNAGIVDKGEATKIGSGIERSVTIKLSALDRPGTSNSPEIPRRQSEKPGPPPNKARPGQSKGKRNETKGTQMRQNQSTQKLQGDDDNHGNDDDDDTPLVAEADRKQKYVLVGWDNFRSKLMIVLLILLVLWAIIYFPLIGT